jgi:hypothetical protein
MSLSGGSMEKTKQALTHWGDFVEGRSVIAGRNRLIHWAEIAEVTEGNECVLIRMKGTDKEFLLNWDYAELREYLAEKTRRDI